MAYISNIVSGISQLMMHQMNFPDSVAKYWAHHVDKFTLNPPLEVRRTCSVQMLAPALAGRWSPLTQPLELPRDLARVVQVANKQPEHRHNPARVLPHLPAFRRDGRILAAMLIKLCTYAPGHL